MFDNCSKFYLHTIMFVLLTTSSSMAMALNESDINLKCVFKRGELPSGSYTGSDAQSYRGGSEGQTSYVPMSDVYRKYYPDMINVYLKLDRLNTLYLLQNDTEIELKESKVSETTLSFIYDGKFVEIDRLDWKAMLNYNIDNGNITLEQRYSGLCSRVKLGST